MPDYLATGSIKLTIGESFPFIRVMVDPPSLPAYPLAENEIVAA